MAHALAPSSPLLPTLETAAEEARAVLHAASVSVSRVEAGGRIVRTIINVGDLGVDEERWPQDEVYVIEEVSRLDEAMRQRHTWTESLDDPDCDPYERELLVRLGKGSSLATPIVVNGDVWGELYLTRHVGAEHFDDEAVSYAEILSAMLGAAVARSLQETLLEEMARLDPLTGLANRRALDEHARRMFGPASTSCAVAVAVDINNLKQVNDSVGHAGGDALIRSVGVALQDAFGGLADVCVARVGGDEFTILVGDHPVDDVVERINRVCPAGPLGGPSGISAGLAVADLMTGSGVSPSALFAAADRAQYEAKRSRSGVVVISQELAPGA